MIIGDICHHTPSSRSCQGFTATSTSSSTFTQSSVTQTSTTTSSATTSTTSTETSSTATSSTATSTTRRQMAPKLVQIHRKSRQNLQMLFGFPLPHSSKMDDLTHFKKDTFTQFNRFNTLFCGSMGLWYPIWDILRPIASILPGRSAALEPLPSPAAHPHRCGLAVETALETQLKRREYAESRPRSTTSTITKTISSTSSTVLWKRKKMVLNTVVKKENHRHTIIQCKKEKNLAGRKWCLLHKRVHIVYPTPYWCWFCARKTRYKYCSANICR